MDLLYDEEDVDWEAIANEADLLCEEHSKARSGPPVESGSGSAAGAPYLGIVANETDQALNSERQEGDGKHFFSSNGIVPLKFTSNAVKRRFVFESEDEEIPRQPAHEVDEEAAATWIYPENREVREYQLKIAETALFANTLVCLPTGLGKTLIAAVVMYNYYRWFPRGKIVFLAPTKPLVWQQIEACHNIMGIPQHMSVFMTGQMKKQDRALMWASKRVFFVTGQILERDIIEGHICPMEAIVCLVVDEAHRATGNAAYCVAVQQLMEAKARLRILALTATPGGDMARIQGVLNSLCISELEYRDEHHPEVRDYVQDRQCDVEKVFADGAVKEVQNMIAEELFEAARPLGSYNPVQDRDATKIGAYIFLHTQQRFKQAIPPGMTPYQVKTMEQAFMAAHALASVCERVATHGVQRALAVLQDCITRPWLRKHLSKLQQVTRKMEQIIEHGSASPKLDRLAVIVTEHFSNCKHNPSDTRIIVFTNFRESVLDIVELLATIPGVQVKEFIGQSTAKTVKGQTQKLQQAVIKEFRDGKLNVLVATSIGEEGLDVGEVDLVVCFDTVGAGRMTQRMGRTGRKRAGRVVILASEGREFCKQGKNFRDFKLVGRLMQKPRNDPNGFAFHPSPRMLPSKFDPVLEMKTIQPSPFKGLGSKRKREGSAQMDDREKKKPLKRRKMKRLPPLFKDSPSPSPPDSLHTSFTNGVPAVEPPQPEGFVKASSMVPQDDNNINIPRFSLDDLLESEGVYCKQPGGEREADVQNAREVDYVSESEDDANSESLKMTRWKSSSARKEPSKFCRRFAGLPSALHRQFSGKGPTDSNADAASRGPTIGQHTSSSLPLAPLKESLLPSKNLLPGLKKCEKSTPPSAGQLAELMPEKSTRLSFRAAPQVKKSRKLIGTASRQTPSGNCMGIVDSLLQSLELEETKAVRCTPGGSVDCAVSRLKAPDKQKLFAAKALQPQIGAAQGEPSPEGLGELAACSTRQARDQLPRSHAPSRRPIPPATGPPQQGEPDGQDTGQQESASLDPPLPPAILSPIESLHSHNSQPTSLPPPLVAQSSIMEPPPKSKAQAAPSALSTDPVGSSPIGPTGVVPSPATGVAPSPDPSRISGLPLILLDSPPRAAITLPNHAGPRLTQASSFPTKAPEASQLQEPKNSQDSEATQPHILPLAAPRPTTIRTVPLNDRRRPLVSTITPKSLASKFKAPAVIKPPSASSTATPQTNDRLELSPEHEAPAEELPESSPASSSLAGGRQPVMPVRTTCSTEEWQAGHDQTPPTVQKPQRLKRLRRAGDQAKATPKLEAPISKRRPRRGVKRAGRGRSAAVFFEEEAQVSGDDDMSSDEEPGGTTEDALDDFIDDGTQNSLEGVESADASPSASRGSPDDMGIYRRSLLSQVPVEERASSQGPVFEFSPQRLAVASKFKLRYLPSNFDPGVYSQGGGVEALENNDMSWLREEPASGNLAPHSGNRIEATSSMSQWQCVNAPPGAHAAIEPIPCVRTPPDSRDSAADSGPAANGKLNLGDLFDDDSIFDSVDLDVLEAEATQLSRSRRQQPQGQVPPQHRLGQLLTVDENAAYPSSMDNSHKVIGVPDVGVSTDGAAPSRGVLVPCQQQPTKYPVSHSGDVWLSEPSFNLGFDD